jgi:hypothetical protein
LKTSKVPSYLMCQRGLSGRVASRPKQRQITVRFSPTTLDSSLPSQTDTNVHRSWQARLCSPGSLFQFLAGLHPSSVVAHICEKDKSERALSVCHSFEDLLVFLLLVDGSISNSVDFSACRPVQSDTLNCAHPPEPTVSKLGYTWDSNKIVTIASHYLHHGGRRHPSSRRRGV